ncbi:MAG TPA: hypothetical protein VMP68_03320, partial [Candidatus Eisenbacteria bacterium]|nr:hypothetical protein [Candidatus Eisenbacteria bacterium]
MVRALRFVLSVILLCASVAAAQTTASAPATPTSTTTTTATAFDINAAVDAYLAKMPPARRAMSDAYFEGGYWLILWDLIVTLIIMWLLLHFKWSAKMRNLAERATRFRPLQTALYWIQFLLVTSILSFPMTMYEGFFRERKYHLMNQTFGGWMKDQLIGLMVGLILGAILMIPLFGIVRR